MSVMRMSGILWIPSRTQSRDEAILKRGMAIPLLPLLASLGTQSIIDNEIYRSSVFVDCIVQSDCRSTRRESSGFKCCRNQLFLG